MIGYAEHEIFSKEELELHVKAVALVQAAPYEYGGELVRCHELARAVGRILELEVQDGRFGFVEHSWLWTAPFEGSTPPWIIPNILDVYVPGRVPQVQLVDARASGLPHCYALCPIDGLVIREQVVDRLVAEMRTWGYTGQLKKPHGRSKTL